MPRHFRSGDLEEAAAETHHSAMDLAVCFGTFVLPSERKAPSRQHVCNVISSRNTPQASAAQRLRPSRLASLQLPVGASNPSFTAREASTEYCTKSNHITSRTLGLLQTEFHS